MSTNLLTPMTSGAATTNLVQLNSRLRLLLPLFPALILFVAYESVRISFTGAQSDTPSILQTLVEWTPLIATGFRLDILMSVIAICAGTFLGVYLGISQISSARFVRSIAKPITQLFRNAPWLVLIFYCMFLIPFEVHIGGASIPFPGWIKAIIALTLPVMANVSEITRGAIQSIPTGQWEAAESLAYTRKQTLWKIILPQCVKRMIPPWMNLYALLIMSTPIASIVGVHEALSMTQAAIAAVDRPVMLAPFYLYVLAFFFVYCYPISKWSRYLERRLT